MSSHPRGNTIKGTVEPESFKQLVDRDQMNKAMKNELHKVSKNKPDRAIYNPKEKSN